MRGNNEDAYTAERCSAAMQLLPEQFPATVDSAAVSDRQSVTLCWWGHLRRTGCARNVGHGDRLGLALAATMWLKPPPLGGRCVAAAASRALPAGLLPAGQCLPARPGPGPEARGRKPHHVSTVLASHPCVQRRQPMHEGGAGGQLLQAPQMSELEDQVKDISVRRIPLQPEFTVGAFTVASHAMPLQCLWAAA